MNFDKVKKATDILGEIADILESIGVDSDIISQNDDKNILLGLAYDNCKDVKKVENKILRKVKKLEKLITLNHIIINSKVVIIQGSDK